MKALITRNMIRFSGQVPEAVQKVLGLTGGFDYLNLTDSKNLQTIRQVLESNWVLEVRNEEDLKLPGYCIQYDSDAESNLVALILSLKENINNSDILKAGEKVSLLAVMLKDYDRRG